jgi:hypothetical protein
MLNKNDLITKRKEKVQKCLVTGSTRWTTGRITHVKLTYWKYWMYGIWRTIHKTKVIPLVMTIKDIMELRQATGLNSCNGKCATATSVGCNNVSLVHKVFTQHHYYKVWDISPFNRHIVGSRACHLIKEQEEFLECVKKWPMREQANAFVDIHCFLLIISRLVYLKFTTLLRCEAVSWNTLIECHCWAIYLNNTKQR